MLKINSWIRICFWCGLVAAAALSSRAQTLTTLHDFDATDGSDPIGWAGAQQSCAIRDASKDKSATAP